MALNAMLPEEFMPTLDDLFEFVYDRQLVWHNRFVLGMPKPWTTNPLLQAYKFTNVYRELDKTSIHLIERICSKETIPPEEKLFNLIIGRVFNLHNTFDILFPVLEPRTFDWKFYERVLDSKMAKGVKLWNPAYTVTQMKFDPEYRKDKHAQFLLMFDFVSKNIDDIHNELRMASSLQEAVKTLSKVRLIGEFLASEIVQDLTYCRPHYFVYKLDDNHDLATVGPGTIQSLQEMYNDPTPNRKVLAEYIKRTWMRQEEMFNKLRDRTGKDWMEIYYRAAYSNQPYLSMNNVESVFCEARKYFNIARGTGRRRNY